MNTPRMFVPMAQVAAASPQHTTRPAVTAAITMKSPVQLAAEAAASLAADLKDVERRLNTVVDQLNR